MISRNKVIFIVAAIAIGASAFAFATSGTKVRSTFNSISNTLPISGETFEASPGGSTGDSLGGAVSANQNSTQAVNAVANRKIIRAAEVMLSTPDVAAAARRVTRVMEQAGGYLANQEGSFGAASHLRIEFRVPSLAFDRALGGLDSIGKVEATNITSSEVTAQYVDIESRIKTLRAATERIRTLLATASRAEIVSLEGELAKRESELASIEGQMSVLSDQVQLSRITVTLNALVSQEPVIDEAKAKATTFSSAFRSSMRVLGVTGRGLMIAIGALLPFIPFLLVVAMGVMLFRGIRRNRQARAMERTRSLKAKNLIQTTPKQSSDDESSEPSEKVLV